MPIVPHGSDHGFHRELVAILVTSFLFLCSAAALVSLCLACILGDALVASGRRMVPSWILSRLWWWRRRNGMMLMRHHGHVPAGADNGAHRRAQ